MENDNSWWQKGVIYQIYPRSFQDSTGSGTGDLAGIIRRLDYLQWLGVSAIWLTPVYPSPQVDNGYDVADYCDIDPLFGTLAEFEMLTAQAHQRQIRVVMDMVFNHTSTQHPWFVAAASDRQSPWRDFYIWREGKDNGPPNNWQSKFGGSAWQWHQETQQYYLHTFAPGQADLNWQDPRVRDALKNVCHFWADRGVDGLRLDVINLVSKHPEFPDDHTGDGRRFYSDGPEIHTFLTEMNRNVFTPRGLMTVGEMSSTSLEHCQRYAQLSGEELSMTFNFHHLKVDYPNGEKWALARPDWLQLKQIFSRWQQGMHGKAWNALFWCNHDQPRIVSRLGDEGSLRAESAKMLAMVLHGMQGTPYVYQGEELAMTNPHFSQIEQYRDVESLNAWTALRQQGKTEAEVLAVLAQKSRDNSRTPMQWNSQHGAGFTSGHSWIDLADNAQTLNVASQQDDPDSVLHCYRHLISLRRSLSVLTDGDYHDLAPEHPALWCYQREDNHHILRVVANISHQTVKIDDSAEFHQQHWQWLYGNYKPEGHNVNVLRPYECIWWIKESQRRYT